MSNALTKIKLSGSTDGKPISIAAGITPGTLIHTAVAGVVVGDFDEIWLWLMNNHSADVLCTIEFGDATTTNNIKYSVIAQDGLKCVLPGVILQNGATVKIFAATTGVVSAVGFVNQIDHT